MWSRGKLKEKAKIAFKANYWKCVLVAFVLLIVLGGNGGTSGGASTNLNRSDSEEIKGIITEVTEANSIHDMKDVAKVAGKATESIADEVQNMPVEAMVIMAIVFIIVFVIVLVIYYSIKAFLLNPLQLGCRKFFVKNLNEKASLKEIGAGFETNYMNTVKAMFLVDVYVGLWSLLFIIPGIIKKYQYRMVVYLLAQDPNLTPKEALAKSSEMMRGQKWKAFVLDLSFIGWEILGLLTCGILSTFYVNPYEFQTEAALFEELNGGVFMKEYQAAIETNSYETYVEM